MILDADILKSQLSVPGIDIFQSEKNLSGQNNTVGCEVWCLKCDGDGDGDGDTVKVLCLYIGWIIVDQFSRRTK